MGSRIGRWVTITTLEDGTTVRRQNRPKPKQTRRPTVLEPELVARVRFQRQRREVQEREQQHEDRIIRQVLGVNVR